MMTSKRAPQDLAGAGPALFRLVRFWSRRWLVAAGDKQRQIQGIAVLDAVDTATREGTEVSITDVAYELGLDHSGASRFVAAGIEEGHLARTTSATDSRRATLTVTAAGHELLGRAQTWQEGVYAALVADWDPADAARLATYLRRLSTELNEPAETPATATASSRVSDEPKPATEG